MSVESDPWWTDLADVLRSVGVVEERDPYGLVVSSRKADGTSTVVEIVMTTDELIDLVSIPWGEFEAAAQHVRELVLTQPPDQRYLVYDCYDLVPSPHAGLPPTAGRTSPSGQP